MNGLLNDGKGQHESQATGTAGTAAPNEPHYLRTDPVRRGAMVDRGILPLRQPQFSLPGGTDVRAQITRANQQARNAAIEAALQEYGKQWE